MTEHDKQGSRGGGASGVEAALMRLERALEKVADSNREILDRLARMEVQQTNQALELHHQHERIKDVTNRLSALEVEVAVTSANATKNNERLVKRWAAVGAVGLVILAAIGTAIGNAAITVLSNEDSRGVPSHYLVPRNWDEPRSRIDQTMGPDASRQGARQKEYASPGVGEGESDR